MGRMGRPGMVRRVDRGLTRPAIVLLTLVVVLPAAAAATPTPPASPPTSPPVADDPPAITLPPATEAADPASGPLRRVAAVGASATHGFFAQLLVESGGRMRPATMSLSDALAAVLPEAEETINAGSALFFRSPDEWGHRLLEQARAARPDTVVGVDFLFWFGYGATGRRPGTAEDAAIRATRLERGLALLDELGGRVVVGDLPDMSAAVGRMLSAGQVPATAARLEMNRRIEAWADERPEVTFVSLNGIMTRIEAGERFGVPDDLPLLMTDRLHPTADGLIVVAREIARRLVEERPEIEAASVELDHDAAIVRLRRRLAARLDREQRLENRPPASPPSTGGG